MATTTVVQTSQEESQHQCCRSYFSMGRNTHRVPMSLHKKNRSRLLERFSDSPQNSLIVVEGGKQETRHATDHEPLFRQESYFQWLFGVMEPDCFGALHVGTGETILFIPRLPAEYAVWMGDIRPPEYFKNHYEVDRVHFVDEMPQILDGFNSERVFLLQGLNSDSGNTHQPPQNVIDQFKDKKAAGSSASGEEVDVLDFIKLHHEIGECRVIKTQEELELMRYVSRVSSAAHVAVMRACKPGMMEYQLESLFLHYSYKHGGCRHMSYTCICGAGINSRTLHYGHAGAPNDRLVQNGDMILLDMGAEYHCYASDITCSYPANGKFTEEQRGIYEAVLAAQNAVLAAIKPGVSWVEMHLLAERTFLAALKKLDIVQGDLEEMMENRIGALFMPHGLGHLLGIDTHDVGGYPEGGNPRITKPGLKSLRTARTLEPGMVLTVEPGVYFIRAVLEPAFDNPEKSRFLNRARIEGLLEFGGVRLEDDVVVTADGVENFTVCPRTVEEIERVMAGGDWPATDDFFPREV